MKGPKLQYFLGSLLLLVGGFQVYKQDFWECSLYFSAGLSFIVMALVREKRFPRYSKVLDILSWTLIIITGLIFLYLVRTDQMVAGH